MGKGGLKKGQVKHKIKPDTFLPNPTIDPSKSALDSLNTKIERPKERPIPINGATPTNSQNGVFAVHERRKRVSDLYLKGCSQWEIGKEIGCTQDTVSKDLQAIQKAWLDRAVDAFDGRRAMEVAKLDYLERKAQEAFDRSCGMEVVETEVDRTSEQGGSNEKRVQKKKLIGDPRFLQQIERCIELRCKIFGFMKDDKGNQVNVFNINWQEVAGATSGADEIEHMIKSAGVERAEESDEDG